MTAVSVINADMTAHFTINVPLPGSLTASIGAGAIIDPFGNPNGAFSGNYTVEGCVPNQYIITPGTDLIVAGTTDIGNHTDDGDTLVTLPFSFQLYGQNFSSVNLSSNGRLDFVVPNEPGGFTTSCLPAPPNQGPFDKTVFGMWEDMRTDAQTGCSGFPGGTCGIFTRPQAALNRIFNIEWRTVLLPIPARDRVLKCAQENPAQNQRLT